MSETSRPADLNPDLPTDRALAAKRASSVRDDLAEELDAVSNLPLTERQQLADQLFLDSLLAQTLRPQEAGHRKELVSRVMQAVRSESIVPATRDATAYPSKSRGAWVTTLVSLAGVLILGLLFLSPHAGPQTALAAVERSLQAAAEDVDRQYRILMTKDDAATLLPITLTVRGAERFVWEQPVPLGTTRVGSNGNEYWMVPSVGPVIVAGEGSRIERLLSEKQLTTPILTLTTALEWLRDRYDLERMADKELPSAADPDVTVDCEHIRGRLRQTDEILKPVSIEIWSDRRTGVVQRMTADWPSNVKFGPLHGELQLQVTPRDLPTDWYEHGRHHAANRLVIRRPLADGKIKEESPP